MKGDLLGGKDWKQLFVDRGVWDLTPEYIETWRSKNETFFSYVERYVPPGGKIAELGCGPGRHAITMAMMGYQVVAVDLDEGVLEQARRNAERLVPQGRIQFCPGNMFELAGIPGLSDMDAFTHGGLMEHFESEDAVRRALSHQLDHAPHVIFDVPLGTAKNKKLFAGDGVFRQAWTSEEWVGRVLKDFKIVAWQDELHDHPSMTDDLVCVLARST